MTYRVLLVCSENISTNLNGLDAKAEKTDWNYITPFSNYDMLIVDNSSVNAKNVRIAIKARKDFSDFVASGGLLVCLCSQPKNYSGYVSYGWIPLPEVLPIHAEKVETQSLKIRRTTYERFIENQKDNLSCECKFSLNALSLSTVKENSLIKSSKLGMPARELPVEILTTGLDDTIAFSMKLGKGTIICLPQFRDKSSFLASWLPFWISKRPEWLEKFRYKMKSKMEQTLRTINSLERLLYGNDNELRDSVIGAFRILGFDAKTAGGGTIQDINLSYESFLGIAEVKGVKSHADLDDMRALLDYFDANITKQSTLKGIFVVNHYRNAEPGQKEKPYTNPALDLAARKKFCLLTSEDLYFAIEKVFEKPELITTIRQKIIEEEGLIRLTS